MAVTIADTGFGSSSTTSTNQVTSPNDVIARVIDAPRDGVVYVTTIQATALCSVAPTGTFSYMKVAVLRQTIAPNADVSASVKAIPQAGGLGLTAQLAQGAGFDILYQGDVMPFNSNPPITFPPGIMKAVAGQRLVVVLWPVLFRYDAPNSIQAASGASLSVGGDFYVPPLNYRAR